MMTRPFLLTLLIYGLVLTALATLRGELLALAIPLIIYLGAGLFYRPEQLRLKITRQLNADHVAADTPVTVRLTLLNEGPRLEEVLLEDLLPEALELREGYPRHLISLQPGETVELSYHVQGGRGVYGFEEVRVTGGETLGLFTQQAVLSAPSQFLVLPEVQRLRRIDIRPQRTQVYSGLISARRGGPGVEFFGVREYQPGDPLRWVNERTSARYPHTMFVNEFEQERVADVGLIMDARQQSDAQAQGRSLFEHVIGATAALADVFLSSGNRVGLFIYGRFMDWTFPGYGKVQRERIMRALARAQLGEGHVFAKLEHLPTRLFPARSQLVFISPLLPEDAGLLIILRARGYRLLIITPDPISFEQKGLKTDDTVALAARLAGLERELLLRKLRQADIQVVEWQVDTPFQQVAHAALSRFRR